MDTFIAYFKDPRIFLTTSKKNENPVLVSQSLECNSITCLCLWVYR